jgi:flagellar basal body-associated protein FliL
MDKKSSVKIILIVSSVLIAVAAAIVGVYLYLNRRVKAVVLGKIDFDGDGQVDAVMLDTTGNGEVDTIILNSLE